MEITRNSEANSFYLILSGFFNYDKSKLNEIEVLNDYHHWRNRIFDGNYQPTFNYLNHNYYDTYLNNSFPEIRNPHTFDKKLSKTLLNHMTFKNTQVLGQFKLELRDKNLPFTIEYADIYLYPSEIGVFTFKCVIDKEKITIGEISEFSNAIRLLNTEISQNDEKISLKQFAEIYLLKGISFNSDWDMFNPQLKSYIQVDLIDDISEDELNYLLFDLGNISPIGSAKGVGSFAPHPSYFNEQLKNNKLTVFRNWSALSLYDTFTRVSINFEDQFRSWEYDYFNIYIHCLYIKFYMYLTNSAISDVTVINKKNAKLRDNFVEFVNDYYHSHISYKFLPDLIQDKLIFSLEIQSEVEKMETKIRRINEHSQEKGQKKMNLVLLVITLLSVISLIKDVSAYFVDMGMPYERMYPQGSIIIGISLIISLLFFFSMKLRR